MLNAEIIQIMDQLTSVVLDRFSIILVSFNLKTCSYNYLLSYIRQMKMVTPNGHVLGNPVKQ